MSEIKERTVEFLLAQRQALVEQLDEVNLLLSVLDYAEEEPVAVVEPVKPKRKKRDITGMTREEIAQRSQDDLRRIVDLLDQNGGKTIIQVAEYLGVAESVAGKKLVHLLERGRVKRRLAPKPAGQVGGRASYVYTLDQIVPEQEHHLDERTNVVVD